MMKNIQANLILVAILIHKTRASGFGSTPSDVRKRELEAVSISERNERLDLKEDGIILSLIEDGEKEPVTISSTVSSKSKSGAKSKESSAKKSSTTSNTKSGAKSKESSAKKSSTKSNSKSKSKSKSASRKSEQPNSEMSMLSFEGFMDGTFELPCADNKEAKSTNFTETQVATVKYGYTLEVTANASDAPALLKSDLFVYIVNGICPKDRRLFERRAWEEDRRLEILAFKSVSEDIVSGYCIPTMDMNNTCVSYEAEIMADIIPYGPINTTKMAKLKILYQLDSYVKKERFLKIEGVVAMNMVETGYDFSAVLSSSGRGNTNALVGTTVGMFFLCLLLF